MTDTGGSKIREFAVNLRVPGKIHAQSTFTGLQTAVEINGQVILLGDFRHNCE